MADVVTDAVHATLQAAPLTALLSAYHNRPAVFTTRPVPPDCRLPYILTEGDLARGPFDTKNSRGVSLIRDIFCYAAAEGDASTIEEIAGIVFDLFHRKKIQVEGFTTMVAEASGPIVAPTDDTIYGRMVSVRLVLMRSETAD